MALVPLRNKAGVVQGQVEENTFDLTKPVRGSHVANLIQFGHSNGLNAATWMPYYALSTDLTP